MRQPAHTEDVDHREQLSSGNCVEVAKLSEDVIAVRDSKDPDGPQLLFTSAEWRAFADGMAKGEFAYLVAALPTDRHAAP